MPKSKRRKRSSKNVFIGVTMNKRGNRYSATITNDGDKKYLGSYDTAKQAAKAFDEEAIKLQRPFSLLNYPKQAPVGYTPIQKPLRSNNTVGYRGIQKRVMIGGKHSFRAQIMIGGKHKQIGTYDTAKEAAIAYDRAILKASRPTSLLNFPDMVHNLDVEPKRKEYKRSSTGYRGVTEKANGKLFIAQIYDVKMKSLGTFETAIQAALAYDQAAIKKGYTNSRLNFPKDQKRQKKEKLMKEKKQKKQKKQKKTKKKELLAIQEYKEMLEIWNDME